MSVVIPSWNGRDLLPECLASLGAQTRSDFDVIVVDNGSEDGSVEFLRETYPEVSIIALDANRGFAWAGTATRCLRAGCALGAGSSPGGVT